MPLPSAVEAEAALLGVLIRDHRPLPDTLAPSDFFEPKHQDIALAIMRASCTGEKLVAETTVSDCLRKQGSTVEAWFVSQMSTAAPEIERPSWEHEIVRTSKLRRLSEALSKAVDGANDQNADLEGLVDYTASVLDRIERKPKQALVGPTRMDFDALMDFKRNSDPTCVLGSNRWLCKGGSMLIVGQSGTGKSSLMMQAAVHWCTGRDFFGIKTGKPLRAVVLQAENDAGDISEALQDVIAGAYLDSNERATLRDHLAIFRDTVSTGTTFTAALRQLIIDQRADIVFVDPLLSFAGIDVSDQEQASKFLRHDLAPILLETGAVLVAMHHTGKPKAASDKEGHTVADLAYAGLGSSEFTNWFREVAVLFRCQGEEPIYKFGLTKRRGRAGLKDGNGQFKAEINIRHAAEKGVIRWEYAHTPAEVVQQDAISSPAKASPRQDGGY
jgi:hypothetical protein